VNGVDRGEIVDLRDEMREEFRGLRSEVNELRNELVPLRRKQDEIQGALNLVKWLGPGALIAGIGALVAAYSDFIRPPI